MVSFILQGRDSCFSHWRQWKAAGVSNLLKVTPSAVCPGSGTWLLTIPLYSRWEPPFGASSAGCSPPAGLHTSSRLPKGPPACLSIALISDPRAPAAPASTCCDQRQSLPQDPGGPLSWGPAAPVGSRWPVKQERTVTGEAAWEAKGGKRQKGLNRGQIPRSQPLDTWAHLHGVHGRQGQSPVAGLLVLVIPARGEGRRGPLGGPWSCHLETNSVACLTKETLSHFLKQLTHNNTYSWHVEDPGFNLQQKEKSRHIYGKTCINYIML